MNLKKVFSMIIFMGFSWQAFALEVNINRAYSSKEKASARIYCPPHGSLYFRIYSIKNPVAYLRGQNNAHSLSETNERISSGGLLIWKGFLENLKWSMFQTARRYISADYRKKIMSAIKIKKYNYPYIDRYPEQNLFKPLSTPHPLIKQWKRKLSYRHGWYGLNEKIPKLANGFYLLEVSQGRNIAYTPLIISDIAMIVKEGASNRLVYGVDLKTNKPLKRADVIIYNNDYSAKTKKIIEKGSLKNGIYFKNTSFDKRRLLYLLKRGNDYALSDIYIYSGGDRIQFRYGIYSERPVYRKGQKVYLKGYLLKHKQGELTPLQKKVTLTVKAPGRKNILTKVIKLNEFGSFSDALQLSEHSESGYYTIEISLGKNSFSGGFYVEQYKKPVFEVKIEPEKKFILKGNNMQFTLTANYYSGGAIADAKVRYTIERMKIDYPWWYGEEYSWYYEDDGYYGYWNHVATGKTTTNVSGEAIINYLPEKTNASESSSDYFYRIKADVTSKSRETISASATTRYVQSQISIRLKQKRWYYTLNRPVDLELNLSKWSNDQAATNITVRAELFYWQYDKKLKKYIKSGKAIEVLSGISNEDGKLNFNFSAVKKSGLYKIRVSLNDPNGKSSVKETSFGAYGNDFEDDSSRSEISLAASKKKYEVGDTATIKIKSPSKNSYLLLTKENSDIIDFELLKVTKNNFEHSVKLSKKHTPNINLTAQIINFTDKVHIYSGRTTIILPPKDNFINFSIQGDRENYRPGEKARYIITARDSKGKPVLADFSLAVVDAAIYAIKSESLPSLPKKLFPKIYNSVKTSFSPEFRFYGYSAEKKLFAELRNNSDIFAGNTKGERETSKIRKNFKDTAYWVASGRTNSKGQAMVEFHFPDNLTRWRLTLHGVSKKGKAGTKITKVKVSKPLSIRLGLPRFFREGDKISLTALIYNHSNKEISSKFSLKNVGFNISSTIPSTIKIAANREKTINFISNITSYPQDGQAIFKVSANANNGESDALERKIPILPLGISSNKYKSAFLDAKNTSTEFSITRPQGARENLGFVEISFSSGVASAIYKTLPHLIKYPYGCVEQTLSRFLPLLEAKKISRRHKIRLPDKEVKEYTQKSLTKLYQYQHYDGGWGWWSNDETSAYMTAYTLHGLRQAQLSGVKVDRKIIVKGLKRLMKQIHAIKKPTATESIFQQYALLSYPLKSYFKNKANRIRKKIFASWMQIIKTPKLNPYNLALIAISSFDNNNKRLYNKALVRMLKYSQVGPANTMFLSNPYQKYRYYWHNDKEELNAYAALALMKNYRTYKKYAKALVLWILRQKKIDTWGNTKSTALSISALARYAQVSNERLKPFSISLNGSTIKRKIKVDPQAEDKSIKIQSPNDLISLNIRKPKGYGLFIRSRWHYYLDLKNNSNRNQGFQVSQNYYRLHAKIENSRKYFAAEKYSSSSIKTGDLILSLIEVNGKKEANYLLLENMLPAGLEPIKQEYDIVIGKKRFSRYGSYAARERLDDKISYSKTYLYKGRWFVPVILRADFPGVFQTMPAQATQMYFPEIRGRTRASVLTVIE